MQSHSNRILIEFNLQGPPFNAALYISFLPYLGEEYIFVPCKKKVLQGTAQAIKYQHLLCSIIPLDLLTKRTLC